MPRLVGRRLRLTRQSLIDDDGGAGRHGPRWLDMQLVTARDEFFCVASGIRASTDMSPGNIVCGNGEAGKLRVDHRGASIACCTFIPKSTMFEQRLHSEHHLIVAARAADNHERLAVLHHQRALQRAARPLARRERVGFARARASSSRRGS